MCTTHVMLHNRRDRWGWKTFLQVQKGENHLGAIQHFPRNIPWKPKTRYIWLHGILFQKSFHLEKQFLAYPGYIGFSFGSERGRMEPNIGEKVVDESEKFSEQENLKKSNESVVNANALRCGIRNYFLCSKDAT